MRIGASGLTSSRQNLKDPEEGGEKINSAGFIDQTPAILHSSEVAVMAGMVLLKGAGGVD